MVKGTLWGNCNTAEHFKGTKAMTKRQSPLLPSWIIRPVVVVLWVMADPLWPWLRWSSTSAYPVQIDIDKPVSSLIPSVQQSFCWPCAGPPATHPCTMIFAQWSGQYWRLNPGIFFYSTSDYVLHPCMHWDKTRWPDHVHWSMAHWPSLCTGLVADAWTASWLAGQVGQGRPHLHKSSPFRPFKVSNQ